MSHSSGSEASLRPISGPGPNLRPIRGPDKSLASSGSSQRRRGDEGQGPEGRGGLCVSLSGLPVQAGGPSRVGGSPAQPQTCWQSSYKGAIQPAL